MGPNGDGQGGYNRFINQVGNMVRADPCAGSCSAKEEQQRTCAMRMSTVARCMGACQAFSHCPGRWETMLARTGCLLDVYGPTSPVNAYRYSPASPRACLPTLSYTQCSDLKMNITLFKAITVVPASASSSMLDCNQ